MNYSFLKGPMSDEKFKFECQECWTIFIGYIGSRCTNCGSSNVKIIIDCKGYKIFKNILGFFINIF